MKKSSKLAKNKVLSGDRSQELEILYEIIGTISYNLDLEEVLDRIIKIVSSVTKADSCFLYLISDGSLVLRASKNPHPRAIGNIKIKIGEGITGWVADKRELVAISKKAYDDERFKFFNNLPEDQYEAFLSVPIVYKNNLLGVINIQHRKIRDYKNSEIELIETIARVTGGAIEHARLFTETEMLKEALESRKLIERAKGILMKELNIAENEAYKMLHKKSMDKRMTMKEVANAVIISSEFRNES